MNHIEQVREAFDRLPYTAVPVLLEWWDITVDAHHAPYGYMPSELVGAGTNWERICRYCPDLIAAQVEDEHESAVRTYLQSLSIHIGMHMSHPDDAPDVLEAKIDRVLRDLDPDLHEVAVRIRERVMEKA